VNDTFVLEQPAAPKPVDLEITTELSFYVDFVNGADSNPGTVDQPFKTLLKGLLMCGCYSKIDSPSLALTWMNSVGLEAARSFTGPRAIVLRNGTHFLNETIQFTSQDSNLIIQV
jgi:hypothetical protein